ncbi:MAG: class I SAM-dependent methyltransferase, partial [Myxococcota bacterium]
MLPNGMVNGPNGLNIPPAQRIGFRAPRNNGVYLTSRSMMLNEELTSQRLETTGNRQHWNSGSYMTGLALTSGDLNRWAQPGANGPPARVLDVAGGGSIFPEEVRAFNGLQVDAVDINHAQYRQTLTAANPGMAQILGLQGQNPTTRDALAAIYMQNMDRLHQMHQATNDVIPPGDQAMFNQLYAARQQIAQQAHDGLTIQRSPGNATNLQNIQNDQYGVYLNSWMMNYLTPADRVSALREAIRVVAPGGEIRIQGGDLGAEGSQPGPLRPANMIPAPPAPPPPPQPPQPVAARRRRLNLFGRTTPPPPAPQAPQVPQEAANAPASGPAQFRRWFAGQLQNDGSYLIHNKNVRIDPRSTNTLLVLTIDP